MSAKKCRQKKKNYIDTLEKELSQYKALVSQYQNIISKNQSIENAFNIELGEVDFNYIDLFNTKGFEYKKREKGEYCGIQFHPNYEAKTYNWLKNNIDYKNEKTCLWIVGKEILDK